MLAIIYLSVRPESHVGVNASISWQVFHKFGHCVAYGILTYLLLQSFLYFEKMDLKFRDSVMKKVFVIAVAFGAFNECLQIFIPSRFARIHDVVVNAIAVSVVLFFVKTTTASGKNLRENS